MTLGYLKTTYTYTLNAAIIFFAVMCQNIQAQQLAPTQTEFGQNRIQKREFNWKVLTSSNFELYFYGDGQSLAQNTLVYAESEFERLSGLLGYSPYTRTKIFLYNSVGDMYQSNANLQHTGEINQLESNLTKSKIELAFTGDISTFKNALVNKISEIFVFEMLYGGSLKDALQSSILLTLPEWFIAGVSGYAANGWNGEMDDFMRDAILKKRVKRPEKLTGAEARLFGQSIWNYIAEKYGKDNISNILNLTRIIRNEQTSIGSTLGTSYNKFLKDWRDYYAEQTQKLNGNYGPMRADLRIKPEGQQINEKIITARLSNDQSLIAYVTENQGQYKVWNYVIKTKKTELLMKQGMKNATKNAVNNIAPRLAWAKANTLAIVFEKDSELKLQIIKDLSANKPNGNTSTRKTLKGLVHVSAIDITESGQMLLLSAVKKGQNDLYLFDIAKGGLTQITNDIFDDLDPSFIPNSRAIAFVSNRPLVDSTTKEKANFKSLAPLFGIFRHDGSARNAQISLLADSLAHISKPIAYDDSTVVFLSDEKGISNLYRYAKSDSTIQKINQISNSISNIYDYDLNVNSGAMVFITFENGSPSLNYIRRLDTEAEFELPKLSRATNASELSVLLPKVSEAPSPQADEKQEAQISPEKENIVLKPGEVDTDNYKFDQTAINKQEPRTGRNTRNNGVIIKSSARRDNRIKGPTDFKDKIELVNFDNTFVADPLRRFGWQNTAVFSDVLQNQILKGGIMITPTLKNGDIFADYTNYKNRIDYGLRFDRRSVSEEEDNQGGTGRKLLYNKVMGTISYPISTSSRLSFSPFALTAATRYVNSIAVNTSDNFGGWQLEYVFDKTSNEGINRQEGTRIKAKYESVKGLSRASESFNKLNLDIRNYIKLPENIIFATRISFGRSTGRSPKQYLLGGMDNWVTSNTESRNDLENPLDNKSFNVDNRNDLLFADFATNMRGFAYNKVSGSNHAVINAELRIPLFMYFGQKQSNNSAINNFQATLFSDFGTVWNKRSPFAKQNDFNTKPILNSSPFTGTVTDFKSPILAGYGLGARTSVLGYFVKLDLAWGVDDNQVQKPITYFTLGLDF
jgi:hypothetical protein